MTPQKAVAFFLMVAAAPLLQAKNKKDPGVLALFAQARYVYVEAVDGQQFDPNLYPEDRQAIADVQDAIETWKRYTLTMERKQADLVIVVRKGRLASADVGVSPRTGGPFPGQPRANGPGNGSGNGSGSGPINGSGNGPGMGPGVQMGGEMGPPDDLFEVYQIDPDGRRSNPLWERSMADGLNAPQVLLFRQFREAVDKAYPPQASGQKTGQTSGQPGGQPQKP
jgi:hypothetical protein